MGKLGSTVDFFSIFLPSKEKKRKQKSREEKGKEEKRGEEISHFRIDIILSMAGVSFCNFFFSFLIGCNYLR